MAKRARKRSPRRLRRSLLVPLIVGLLFWWWRRRTESPSSGDEVETPDSVRLESVLDAADDLTRVGGIGPKVSQLLFSAGIATFGQLAAADIGELQRILREAGLSMIDPTSWADEARLAAEAKLDEPTEEVQHQTRGE